MYGNHFQNNNEINNDEVMNKINLGEKKSLRFIRYSRNSDPNISFIET